MQVLGHRQISRDSSQLHQTDEFRPPVRSIEMKYTSINLMQVVDARQGSAGPNGFQERWRSWAEPTEGLGGQANRLR